MLHMPSPISNERYMQRNQDIERREVLQQKDSNAQHAPKLKKYF
jgi:hypothetical protein